MADIFDSIAPSKGDIFDSIVPQEDMFDKALRILRETPRGLAESGAVAITGMLDYPLATVGRIAGRIGGMPEEQAQEFGQSLTSQFQPETTLGRATQESMAKVMTPVVEATIEEPSKLVGESWESKQVEDVAKLGMMGLTAKASPVIKEAGKGIVKSAKENVNLKSIENIIPEKQAEGYSIKSDVFDKVAPDIKTDVFDKVQTVQGDIKNAPEAVPMEIPTEAPKQPEIVQPIELSQAKTSDLIIPEGDLKPHRTAQRVETEAISKELLNREGLGEDIAKYEVEKGMMEKQAQLGVEIMDRDYDAAVKMALGEIPAPEGVRPGTMITAVSKRAMEKGDYETVYKLGTSEKSFTEAQEIAKDLKSFDQGLSDNPVTAIRSVVKARQEENIKTGVKVDPVKQAAEVERLGRELEATQKKLEDYIAKKEMARVEKRSKPPAKYGTSNKIVTQDEYLKIKAELREQFSSQLNAGLDPTIAAKLGKVGVYHIEAGARNFKVWSERLIADVGVWVTPYISELWKQSNEALGRPIKAQDQIALERYKTRLKNEQAKLTEKLGNLDFTKQEKRTTVLDFEARKLRDIRDRAKVAFDAATRKTGTVTREEAAKLLDLAKNAAELKQKYNPTTENWTSLKDKWEYGKAQVAFERYVAKLKEGDTSLSTLVKRRAAEFKNTFKGNPVAAIKDLAIDTLGEISDSSIALVASLDNSFIGRQGLVTLQTHPSIWASAAKKSFSDIYKSLRDKYGNEVAKDILHADLVSRKNYMNGYYQKSGILAKFEEQYPTSHPARVPGIGRTFKASEVAFTNTALRMRMGTFDLLLDMAKKQGLEINKTLIEDIGSVVNSATSRAKMHESKVVKNLLWAPKMMLANLNVLTAHGGGAGLKTSFAKKQAAYNLMKVVGETAAVVAVLNALNQDAVELDPRNSDFLKYRDGNTRIDLTAGRGQYITLAARWISGQTKNAQTKIIKELNLGGFGDNTYFDVGINFLINKTTPTVRQVISVAKGKNFEGKKPTVLSTAIDLTTPIPVKNIYDDTLGDYSDRRAIVLLSNLADVFGVNANTYQPLSQWDNSQAKNVQSFKKRVGEERLQQANVLYNKRVNALIDKAVQSQSYIRLSDEEKQKYIERIKRTEKQRLLGK